MTTRIKSFTRFALLFFACFAQACSSSNQMDKANRLVESGSASVAEGDKLFKEAVLNSDKLFETISPEQYLQERDSVKELAQQAAGGFEKSAAKYREAAAKFDEASKLSIHEKLKEYLTLQTQMYNKRAEQSDISKATPLAFIDSIDAEALQKKRMDNQQRVDELEKEAADLAEKSNKIQQENKSIFKPDSK